MRLSAVPATIVAAAFAAAAVHGASPFSMCSRLEERLVSGDGALLPDADAELVRFAGTVDLAEGDWPDEFRSRTGQRICVAVSPFTGCYEFFGESGGGFWTVVPFSPTTENWVAPFRHAEPGPTPDDGLYAPWRLVDVWLLSHAESAEFAELRFHAENAESAETASRPRLREAAGPDAAVSNLCFTAFSLDATNLFFAASWPTNDALPGNVLDLYGTSNLLSRTWTFLSSHPATNPPVSFSVDPATLPWHVASTSHVHDATCQSITNVVVSPLDGVTVYANEFWSCATNRTSGETFFFRLGTRFDGDGDDLPDAFETLVSLTDPDAADTDGDTMPDGWEVSFGLDPFDPLDAIEDPDGDNIPNVYEFHNGCDPLVSDWETAPKLVAGGTGWNSLPTLEEALAASTPYAIVEIAPGLHSGAGWTGLWLPARPVLVVGRARTAVLHHVGSDMAAFYFDEEQSPHTAFRSIDLELAGSASFQTAFWLGNGSLLHGPGAAPSFANVHVRLGASATDRIGWFVRHSTTNPVVLSACSVDASGAASARGVYAVDSPDLLLENCSFLNFPAAENAPGYAVQFESTASNFGGAANPVSVRFQNCLFDASFTNAWAFAPLTNGISSSPAMHHCIAPDFGPFEAVRTGCIEANPLVLPSGHLVAGAPAIGAASAPRFSALDLDGDLRDSAPDVGADEFNPESGTDSDGDGLSNVAELFTILTDPFRADTDGDGIPDGCEVSEGTDPLDSGNYCFSLSGHLDADLVGTNGIILAVVSTNGGTLRVLSAARPSIPPELTFSFPHLVVTNEPVLKVLLFVDANENGFPDDGESGQSVLLSLSGHDTEVRFSFPNVTDDVDRDGIPDLWELGHGLCSTNALDACSDPDGDGLVNLHEYWHDYDPWIADGSNTVLSILSRSIDDRIAGKNPTNSLKYFSGYPGNTSSGATNALVANSSCWAADVDFSCESPWNSNARNRKSGTLISSSHILLAYHHVSNSLPLGSKFWFRSQNGEIFTRLLSATNRIVSVPDTDWVVGLLNEPLPSSVPPARILPSDFSDYMGSGKRLPCASLDQEGKILVAEINALPPLPQGNSGNPVQIGASQPSLESRESFFEILIPGDSSNPKFLLFGDQPILLSIHWNRNHSGTSIKHSATLLESAMEELSPGGNWHIPCFDFSGFPKIGGFE